ncbi:MAG TPA: J domain-containing protein [Candidatus Nanoarchaeia archaeon]|nr:J domain-containing protein [Candidatus Nanoarchaeia archaeon]
MVKVKGHEIKAPHITNSFDRRAMQIKNSIILTLKSLGINNDYVKIDLENNAMRKAPATASWYYEGRNLKYSYALMTKFVENLYIIDQVLKIEVKKLLAKEINTDEFTREFSEDDDLKEQLQEARKTLGVKSEENDFEVITKNYKALAKKHHPDMPTGDHTLFQKINAAHKLIRKELS